MQQFKHLSSEKQGAFVGECIGTFIMVFFGCGSVCVTVLFASHTGLFQVAAVWGMGVSLAIYSTRYICCAHLNPAVSIAMVVAGRMEKGKILFYLAGQFSGAFLASAVLFLLFNNAILNYELLHGIQRGAPESVATAMIFGEFYPNPSVSDVLQVSMPLAFCAEAVGTFFLVFFIFSLTEGCNVGRPDNSLTPLFIGSAVTLVICIIAPITQAGLNPARDLSPRLLAYMAGWGSAAMPDNGFGFLIVYAAGPVCGAVAAAMMFKTIIEPIMLNKKNGSSCKCSN